VRLLRSADISENQFPAAEPEHLRGLFRPGGWVGGPEPTSSRREQHHQDRNRQGEAPNPQGGLDATVWLLVSSLKSGGGTCCRCRSSAWAAGTTRSTPGATPTLECGSAKARVTLWPLCRLGITFLRL